MPKKTAAAVRCAWGLVVVLAFAAALRLAGIGAWSLWQDEATSLYYVYHLERPFARCFPVFFVMLRGLFHMTGESMVAGRALSVAFGLVGIALVYAIVRRHASAIAGLAATAMLSVSLGHLFWSQTIRYYTLLAFVELVACWMFLDGFERARRGRLVLAGLLLAVAMWIHFTAILLVPALVVYLVGVRAARWGDKGYDWRGLLAFGLPTALAIAVSVPRYLALRALGSGIGPPEQAISPIALLARTVAYYGVPMFALALAAPCFWRHLPRRILFFFLAVTFVPTLELIVLGMRGTATACWNHAFVSLYACAALAGMTLAVMRESGWRRLTMTAATATAVYYLAFLPLYYTQMHGDRPRWQEACQLVREQLGPWPRGPANTRVIASEMEPVALYLGVLPKDMMRMDFVVPITVDPPTGNAEGPEWYVLREPTISPDWARWLARHCELVGRFDAYTGPVSRSVLVYRHLDPMLESP